MRPEVHTLGETPDVVFTTRVQALSALAQQILAAKARGDTLTVAKLLAQFRAQLGTADLPTLAAQAKAADMPADWLLALSQVSDALSSGFGKLFQSLPLLAALAVVGWLVIQSSQHRR